MGEDSAEFVSGVIKQHLIVSLKLTNCAFTDACLKHLSQALMDLKDDNVLEELFLGVNRLSPAGVQDLCSWMQWSQSLLVLDLQLNNFGDAACIPLAAALTKNCHLQALNLQGNAITAQGVALLVHALSQNEKSCVQEVFLGFNPIGDDGAHHLREVVSGVK
jgi:Ran GTPase-activating protein (RanGAP) involved in mRNA processing and transport